MRVVAVVASAFRVPALISASEDYNWSPPI